MWQHQLLLRGRWKGFFLGNYRLIDHLGSGGMCKVFLAQHRQLGRRLAIKVLSSEAVRDPLQVQRFYREARALGRLNHSNIITLHDAGSSEGRHFMALEYFEGADLQQLVEQHGPLACDAAADYVCQVADALDCLHRQDLVHRDIKPGNILVNKHGQVKLLDMGLVLDVKDKSSLTRLQNVDVLGTADYVSPEQIDDSHHVDHRADVYSLGCTLYQLLVGHPPFPSGTTMQRLMSHQSRQPIEMRKLRREIPEEISKLCHGMLAKETSERICSARIVCDRLTKWLGVGKPIRLPLRRITDESYPATKESLSGFGDVATFLDVSAERKAS